MVDKASSRLDGLTGTDITVLRSPRTTAGCNCSARSIMAAAGRTISRSNTVGALRAPKTSWVNFSTRVLKRRVAAHGVRYFGTGCRGRRAPLAGVWAGVAI